MERREEGRGGRIAAHLRERSEWECRCCWCVRASVRACKPANEAPQYSGEAAAKGPFS